MVPSAKAFVLASALLILSIILITHREIGTIYYRDFGSLQDEQHGAAGQINEHGDFGAEAMIERFDLSKQECSAFFPLLYDEITTAKSKGHIGAVPRKDDEHGFLRARIHNRQLYVINRGSDVHHRQYAVLSSIYRALITTPRGENIPNIEFTFCVNDHPAANIWSLSRSEAPDEVSNTWLMPDYAHWSWPEPGIGAMSEIRDAITVQDKHLTWNDKIDKAVWRGTVHWNSDLRGKLMEASKDKPWADVEELEWGQNELSMEEFCKYRFLVYTEGVTYSGRLKYQQLCRSVIITTKMQWKTFLSPVVVDSGRDQNVVVVEDDWSDLDERIQWLQAHPNEAEWIADNGVRMFRDRYMASGAETCYWRELFRAWAEVTNNVGEPVGKELGVRWESFLLMGELKWDKYA